MSLQIGIVGLPNVGKSTLFSAITKKQVDCANFPFCTIDPNVGVVEVPDERLERLAEISQSQKIIPTTIEFVDIAGLVRGAAEGEGLGNTFLAHIRECDAIAQVIRAFEEPEVLHVEHSVDPLRDIKTVELELALADLETVTKRCAALEKQQKSGMTKELESSRGTLQRAKDALEHAQALRDLAWTGEERKRLASLSLLTLKPMLYVINVSESQLQDGSWEARVSPLERSDEQRIIPLCVKLEAELASMSKADAREYLLSIGQGESGLDRLIRAAYQTLNLITFFTSGEKETRAWTIVSGTKAPQAAGVIHSDFEKSFIRAEVTECGEFIACGGTTKCREKGLVRIEGKDYVLRDGDVCYFRVGV